MNAPLDSALFSEPDSGAEQVTYLNVIAQDLLGWEEPRRQLVEALRNNHFLLFAQKIMPLKTIGGEPRFCEVLLRLKEEEDNLLPPGGFFPIAESYGMLRDIDHWVVLNLLAWCAAQREQNPSWIVPVFCVNLSSAALEGPQFAKFVRTELDRAHVPPGTLCFEIAESDIIAYPEQARSFMAALKPAGCRFTLDAFGSVKVSFKHMKGLPLDYIKIDGVIIQNILKTPAELARLRAIHSVCRKVGIRTIAEFVENVETMNALAEVGIDYAQGFGVALPAPIAAVV